MSIHTDAVASAGSRMRAQLDQTLDAGLRGLQHYATTTSWYGATTTSPRRWPCSTATLIPCGSDVALVVGCGPIGLAVIAVLKMRRVSPIVAADFSAERRAIAQGLGADIVVDPAVASPYEAFMAAAATDTPARRAAPTAVAGQLPIRPTVAFECVGAPGLIQQLIGGVPAGSRIVVAGINIGTDRFEPAQAVLKELDIRFSLYYTPEQFAETFTHLAAGDFDVAALLTGTVGLDGVADVFTRLATSPQDAKILLDPSIKT